MISTAYVSLVLHIRLHGVENSPKPNLSLMELRIIRLAPMLVGAAISTYATWFVRRYWLRLPAYRKKLEREIIELETSLAPNLLLE